MIGKHLDLLGMKVKDRVTNYKGVVTCISFDLYGCIQAVVMPEVNKDGECKDGKWFDVSRIEVVDENRVMDVPDYDNGYIAEGLKGSAEKPHRAM